MIECFPETKSSKKNVKNELDLSNYAKKKKTDLKMQQVLIY